MTADAGSRRRRSGNAEAETVATKVQMNVYVPPALVRRVKHKAIDEGSSLSGLVEQALTEYLEAHGEAEG